jgi:signal transduction histidine kinase
MEGVIAEGLDEGALLIETTPGGESYAFAPLFTAEGGIAGGILVAPLDATVMSVLEGPRRAFVNALYVVAAGAVLLAVLLAALVTARLVRPLRIMTRRVERIGAGDYEARLGISGQDEFGRLGAAIDQMASDVSASVETLRAASQMRRELIANVGHDLRTPLAALLGYVEEAERMSQEGRADDALGSLQSAKRQGDYLRSLVSDLFELAVLDAAPTPLRTEPIPLAELLHAAADAHRPQMERSGIDLAAHIPPDLPTVEADGVRLLRLLDNLLSNARRHTPSGGTVELAAVADGERVRLSVRDDGEGMSAEVLQHVFERYYRGTDARTRSGRTGLGLSISRAIAHAHGGTLEATSQPGEGSTFTLTLPV